jgi:hypothetical protein
MPQVQTKKITFKVARAVELEPGLVLPPGLYTGTKTRTRVDSVGGVSWTPSKYKLELTADQLTNLSAQIELNLISKNIDVTKFVRQGKLRVADHSDCRTLIRIASGTDAALNAPSFEGKS